MGLLCHQVFVSLVCSHYTHIFWWRRNSRGKMFNTNFNHIQHIKPCYGLKPSCNDIWFQKQNFLSKSINVNESFRRGRKEKRTYPLHFFLGGRKNYRGYYILWCYWFQVFGCRWWPTEFYSFSWALFVFFLRLGASLVHTPFPAGDYTTHTTHTHTNMGKT